ncbi:N-acetylmuramoyl-L-alanine amidase [Candidatus Giovannonibacteria bacterium]|nr:N-acetylmuramoyl-L-alanine amidase [Candidatus Giovannonibacteria bacterium]
MKIFLAALLLILEVAVLSVLFFDPSVAPIRDFLASVFFTDSVTEESLNEIYQKARREEDKIKILIVPGHDSMFWGTDFRGVKEADLTLKLGEELFRLFQGDAVFDVAISRTAAGYDRALAEFFEEKKDEIREFMNTQRELMKRHMDLGEISSNVIVQHNNAPGEMRLKLYGINKWANDNGIDILIHVHFNDYAGRSRSLPGRYSGFSIYVPERQYSNAKGSQALAASIFNRLAEFYASSDLPKEDAGVVEDQELIAVGANNTLDGAVALVEYGYIYEPLVQGEKTREVAISDLALKTYLGVTDLFKSGGKREDGAFETKFLPYQWERNVSRGARADLDVAALQAALILEGVYPPGNVSKNDCPLSGNFGSCTERALKDLQTRYELSPTGRLDGNTRAKLNELYGL